MTNETGAPATANGTAAASQESTMSNEEESRDVPGGASSLMGLFSPPPVDSNDDVLCRADGIDAETPPKQNGGKTNDETEQPLKEDSESEEHSPHGTAGASEKHSTASPEDHYEVPANLRDQFHRQSTARASGNNNKKHAKTLMEMFDEPDQQPPPLHERLPLLHNREEETPFGDLFPSSSSHERKGSLGFSLDFSLEHMFASSATEPTPKTSGKKSYSATNHARTHTSMSDLMPAIDESQGSTFVEESLLKIRIKEFASKHLKATTLVGSFMFLLYHVVFCLAMGSSIIRKHSETPILGLMAKMSACGVIFSAPLLIYRLGNEVPALYPTVDLFLAPFMAHLAVIVDATLEADGSLSGKDEDQVFIATLAVLSGIGMIFSGTLLVMAGKFKLANLGTYLPYPVLCGFFSAVGLLMWSLAFTVDTNGKSVHAVFTSGDMSLIGNSLLHHLPSLLIAICMKWLGPLNPFLVSALVVCTVAVFYIVLAITGVSLEEAREEQWFWSHDDLVYEGRVTHVSICSGSEYLGLNVADFTDTLLPTVWL